jgi:glycerate kinase
VDRRDGLELDLFHEVVKLAALPARPEDASAKVLCEAAARWAAARLKGGR